jgi:SAM-dependent methyltransferase
MVLYTALNLKVVEKIPTDSRRILDIGCGVGSLGRFLKESMECEVDGITYSSEEADIAKQYLNDVYVFDLNVFDSSSIDLLKYDCIVCSHVLEHLNFPDKFLSELRSQISNDCQVIVALPNALSFRQRINFLFGDFSYTESGVMDYTHFRFFDWSTAYKLLTESGYTVTLREADGYFPMPGLRRFFGSIATKIDSALTQWYPGLFGVQFILIAKPNSES